MKDRVHILKRVTPPMAAKHNNVLAFYDFNANTILLCWTLAFFLVSHERGLENILHIQISAVPVFANLVTFLETALKTKKTE